MSLPEFLVTVFLANIVALGNGSTMLTLFQAQLVQGRGVLTQDQLLYAFAIARVTPGQANFYVAALGYMLFGLPGALLANIVILIPGYTVLALQRGYDRLGTAPPVRAFTRGMTAAMVGVIFAASVQIALSTLTSLAAWLVFALAAALLIVARLHPILTMVIAAAAGVLLKTLLG